ncbi:MAG: BamA/TamA family outer membrane protein [Ignavibacteriaceae bacterium]|nr:BamA/TamA family outer membrane protein [Ignavibacteriaceae bacterium]
MRYIFFTYMCFFLISSTYFAQSEIKYELKKIQFSGNNQISVTDLRKNIYSRETPWWFWKFLNKFTSFGSEPSYFDSLNISEDIRALNDYYVANGYFRASFSSNYSIDSTNKTASLIFYINEGVPSQYGKVEIHGLKTIDSVLREAIFSRLTIDKAKRFSQAIVRENIDRILVELENNGYMLASFDSTIIIKDTVNHLANLDIYLNAGRSYIIDTLEVTTSGEGAQYVENDLLSSIVGIRKNEVYNIDKIRQSQVRLYRTGLFSSVIINPKIADTNGYFVPLQINGTIGLMNELAPEIILNNQQNAFNAGIGGTYTRKNFLGNARKLSVTGQFGLSDFFRAAVFTLPQKFFNNDTTVIGYIEAKSRIEQPYVFNRPIFGILENYGSIQKELNLSSYRFGGKISFEFELPSYTFINFLTAYYNLEYVREVFIARDLEFSLNQTLSILGADLKSTKTDNPLFPTKGYNLAFLMEDANFIPFFFSKLNGYNFNDAVFYKLLASTAFYFPVNNIKTAVLGLKFKVGNIQSYHGEQYKIPSTRRFYAGGSNSIRGWKTRGLNPSYIVVNSADTSNSFFVEGGKFLLESSIEYRYKFFEDFGTTLFFDFGNSWDNAKVFRYDEISAAVGIGFRYYTAIAPFRIDFGFKAYDPTDKRTIFRKPFWSQLEFHFGIGEAF